MFASNVNVDSRMYVSVCKFSHGDIKVELNSHPGNPNWDEEKILNEVP
jgi:hypothetical protein